MRTQFDDQASVQSSWRVSSDDDDVEYQSAVGVGSPPIYTEAWSRFPYCSRLGD